MPQLHQSIQAEKHDFLTIHLVGMPVQAILCGRADNAGVGNLQIWLDLLV